MERYVATHDVSALVADKWPGYPQTPIWDEITQRTDREADKPVPIANPLPDWSEVTTD